MEIIIIMVILMVIMTIMIIIMAIFSADRSEVVEITSHHLPCIVYRTEDFSRKSNSRKGACTVVVGTP